MNGISVFALFLILWEAGKNPLGNWSIPGWILPVIFTIFAIRDHRNKDSEGYITYGRGVGTGLLVAIFSGFLFAALMYYFVIFFAANIPQMQIDAAYANLERVKEMITSDQYNSTLKKIEEAKSSMTPGGLAFSSFEARILGGLIISLIVAAVYRKNRPPFEVSTGSESNPA